MRFEDDKKAKGCEGLLKKNNVEGKSLLGKRHFKTIKVDPKPV